MSFPTLLTSILRERSVCVGFLVAGVVLLTAQALGITVYRCPFQSATGLPCPGCGLTRGTAAFLRGDFQQATAFHPFTPLAVLCIGLLVLSLTLPAAPRTRFLNGLESLERRTGLGVLGLAALMAYGAWRLYNLTAGAPGFGF